MFGLLLIRLDVLVILIYFWINSLHFLLYLFSSCSLGCTIITFMASYENYPSSHALKDLHQYGSSSLFLLWVFCLIYYLTTIWCLLWSSMFMNFELCSLAGNLGRHTDEQWIHIDTFSAMNGISRFCENDFPWRYKIQA